MFGSDYPYSRANDRGRLNAVEWGILFSVVWVLGCVFYPILAQPRFYSGPTFLGNMKQLALATLTYAQDNDDRFPSGKVAWDDAIFPYHKTQRLYAEPQARNVEMPGNEEVWPERIRVVAINGEMYGRSTHASRANTVLFAETHYRYRRSWPWSRRDYRVPRELYAPDLGTGDSAAGWKQLGQPGATRRNGGSYYAFTDGHGKWLRPEQVYSVTNPGDKGEPSFAP